MLDQLVWVMGNNFFYSIFYSIQVVIHDPHEFPNLKQAFVVQPGYESFVSVRLQKVDLLPAPYDGGTCKEEPRKLKYYETYSKDECYRECIADYTISLCGCYTQGIVRK